jgi:hypothetical protein
MDIGPTYLKAGIGQPNEFEGIWTQNPTIQCQGCRIRVSQEVKYL